MASYDLGRVKGDTGPTGLGFVRISDIKTDKTMHQLMKDIGIPVIVVCYGSIILPDIMLKGLMASYIISMQEVQYDNTSHLSIYPISVNYLYGFSGSLVTSSDIPYTPDKFNITLSVYTNQDHTSSVKDVIYSRNMYMLIDKSIIDAVL